MEEVKEEPKVIDLRESQKEADKQVVDVFADDGEEEYGSYGDESEEEEEEALQSAVKTDKHVNAIDTYSEELKELKEQLKEDPEDKRNTDYSVTAELQQQIYRLTDQLAVKDDQLERSQQEIKRLYDVSVSLRNHSPP